MRETGVGPFDWVLFRLAQTYEDEPDRDLRRSRELYATIVGEFPLSRYWDASRERIEYLDRHFFIIR